MVTKPKTSEVPLSKSNSTTVRKKTGSDMTYRSNKNVVT
jgi:hypothetical protein